MPTPDPKAHISDSLSQISRKERRSLLVASATSLLFSRAGIVPIKIDVLGIELSQPDQKYLTLIILMVVLYFSLAFFIYGTADVLVWVQNRVDYQNAIHSEPSNWNHEKDAPTEEAHYIEIYSYCWYKPIINSVAFGRVIFDFLLPLIFGLYAAYSLLYR